MSTSSPPEAGQPPSSGTPPGNSEPPAPVAALGPELVTSCQMLDKACSWVERVGEGIDDILAGVAKSSTFSFLNVEEPPASYYTAGDGWILDGWRWAYPVRLKRERIGKLSIAIDIAHSGRPAEALGLPCVVVLWSGIAHDWAPAIDTATEFWPPSRVTSRLMGQRLFRWAGELPANGPSDVPPFRQGTWFYIVPLSAVASMISLRLQVLQPALELLANAKLDMAFAAAGKVLRFKYSNGHVALIRN